MPGHDIVVVGTPGDPGEAVFQDFLAQTDAAGTGVVFLDTWYTDGNGIYAWPGCSPSPPDGRRAGFDRGGSKKTERCVEALTFAGGETIERDGDLLDKRE